MARGTIYKRSKTWHMQITVNNRQYRKSTGTTLQGEAEAILRKWLVEIDNGNYNPGSNK